jgi:hypothetical protein
LQTLAVEQEIICADGKAVRGVGSLLRGARNSYERARQHCASENGDKFYFHKLKSDGDILRSPDIPPEAVR